MYNPTLMLYFLESFAENCKFPRNMLDTNLSADEEKLRYISCIHKGRQLLLSLIREKQQVILSDIADRFGIQEMLKDESKDNKLLNLPTCR